MSARTNIDIGAIAAEGIRITEAAGFVRSWNWSAVLSAEIEEMRRRTPRVMRRLRCCRGGLGRAGANAIACLPWPKGDAQSDQKSCGQYQEESGLLEPRNCRNRRGHREAQKANPKR
jgi:hypothetical protein